MSNISQEESGSNPEVDVDAAGKYHVLMELGRGGTAVVNAGIARGIGGFTKLVVLKNIKEEFLSDRETVRMFVNEARLSARMNHPNIVQVYEVFRQNRLPVIVMEYLDGQPLARIQTRAFSEPSYTTNMAIAIMCRVLAGLQYAHTLADYDGTPLELVHRDVSPQNVMLTYDGQVKLVDFGIAKLSSSSQNTKTGIVKGKIAYMAPEQLEGDALDRRADLFAVGVMLWEAIARRRMWGARGDAEIVRCLVLDDVPKIRQAVPDIDPELAHICDKALAVLPDERYLSAEQFQSELETYLAKRAVIVRQQDIADLVSRTCADLRDNSAELLKAELAKFAAGAPGWEDAMTAFEELHTPLPESGERRNKWLPFAIVGIVIFGMVAAVYSLMGEPSHPVAAQPTPAEAPQAPPVAPVQQPTPPTAPAPALVTLRVIVTPPEAVVTLDGKPLSGAPLSVSLAKDELEHDLRAEAEGYKPLTRKLRISEDHELTLALEASPAATPGKAVSAALNGKRRPPPPPARPTPVRTAPTPTREPAGEPERTKPTAADCNPPYYIGPDGLKHYRRECL
ncbi:MAG TPA: serine/threonine-protein kinase [Polyangiaceae bacterium]|nr:serine/threonine-protein kinase [Polyangiaceae bacterium]